MEGNLGTAWNLTRGSQPTPTGARSHGFRPVSRAAGRIVSEDAHFRAYVHVLDRGSRGHRLVRAAHFAGKRPRGPRHHEERAEGGVQAFRDGSGIPAAPQTRVA